MSSLLQHAKFELRAAGLFDDDSDFNGEIGVQVMALMETFVAYGHSGGSAQRTCDIFDLVSRHMPLTPLTGEADEWEEVPDDDKLWQNIRCHTVFKDDEGVAWDTKEGHTSHKPIAFPYMPRS